MDQMLDVVDESDKVIGKATRLETQIKGLIYRSAWVMVEDEKGKILLQKRGSRVDTFANYWDIAAAGHVDLGEDYDVAARRELAEELGISNTPLSEIGYGRFQTQYGNKSLDRFAKIYKAVVPSNTPIHFQADEVADAIWLNLAEIKKLQKVHPDLLEVLKLCYS